MSANAGSDGTALLSLTATIASGPHDASFTWYEGATFLGSGASLFVRLPVGEHTLTVRAQSPSGLKATAAMTASVVGLPASQYSVNLLQSTVDAKLDTTVSSRASQDSVAQLATQLASISTGMGELATQQALNAVMATLTRLDVPVSTRAAATDMSALGTKVDQLKAALPSSLDAVTQTLSTLQTRFAIEQALAGGQMVASFYLPTTNGGKLDLVRSIVGDVTDKSDAAGGNATNVARSRRLISDGDLRKTAGDYRGAYLLYLGAYQSLAIMTK